MKTCVLRDNKCMMALNLKGLLRWFHIIVIQNSKIINWCGHHTTITLVSPVFEIIISILFNQNVVSFNANKTQCCLISRRENKNLPDILFGSNTLKMCDSLSMLGVSVASDQSWNEHIASVAKSAARKIGFFSRPCIFSPSTRPNPPLSRIRLSSIERSL